MQRRLALVVLVAAAASLTAAAFAGALGARTVSRARANERHMVAARGAAALCEVYLDELASDLRAGARGFESSAATVEQRLRAVFERSDHILILTLVDEEGRLLHEPLVREGCHGDAAGGRTCHSPDKADIGEHLRAVPLEEAGRAGFALSAPFMRGERGPFVVLAASYRVAGESHATGDPCHPGSRHVIAAEIALDWLVARLRVATGGPHEILLLDEHYRVLGGAVPLVRIAGLGPARSPQAVAVELPGQPAGGLTEVPTIGALAPVPRYGWSVLAQAPRWWAVPPMSSLSIVWAVASLVVLLAAAAALARRAPEPPDDAGR